MANSSAKLYKLKQEILNSNKESNDSKTIVRSLDYLISYTEYASLIKEYRRALNLGIKMFENVKYIVENESKTEKLYLGS
jgi:erythromycin esterase